MKPGQRYGKTQLTEDIRTELAAKGFDISVRNSKLFVDTFLDCAIKGLRKNGSLVIDKLGSFSIQENKRVTNLSQRHLRIKYRTTTYLKSMLKNLWSL